MSEQESLDGEPFKAKRLVTQLGQIGKLIYKNGPMTSGQLSEKTGLKVHEVTSVINRNDYWFEKEKLETGPYQYEYDLKERAELALEKADLV